MPEDIIENRIAQLSPDYKAFIESDFIGEAASTFSEASGFSERQTEILENALTFYLLFFLSEADAIAFISRNCDLSLDDADLLFKGIKSTFPEGVDALVRSQYSQVQSAPTEKLASEIAETERAIENLQGIRTMAGDMREAQTHHTPTYQSSQSDLIRSGTPTPPPQNGPQWETDK